MIRYLKNEEIDVRKWDECVNKSFNGIPCALSWFLDLVHEGWEGLVENDYERIMPLTSGKKFGIHYLFQPYFSQQLGVFSTSLLNPEIVNAFINAIPPKFKFVDIKLNIFNQPDLKSIELISNKNYVLDLIHEYPRIAEKYSGQTKRNLKKASRSTLTLMKNIKPESVISLFRENRGKTLGKWNETHYNRLKRLIYSSIYKGRGIVYGVFTAQNELCAGAFFMKNNNRLIFLFSGSDQIARENAAMTFLLDAVIQEFTPSHMVLDFEGSNDRNLARFYQGFGAKEIVYMGLRMNKLNFPAKQMFSIYRQIKKR